MRHPPRSGLLVVLGAAVALVGTAVAPVLTASGATPACTVEYPVTSAWDAGCQGSVRITNSQAALSSWSPALDFGADQKLTRGWNARWSRSSTTVSAAGESRKGSLGTGASVSAGFAASRSGSNPVRASFRLTGATCNVESEPTPTPTPAPTDPSSTDPPAPEAGAPVVHVSGNKLVDSGGEFARVQGNGSWDGPVDDA